MAWSWPRVLVPCHPSLDPQLPENGDAVHFSHPSIPSPQDRAWFVRDSTDGFAKCPALACGPHTLPIAASTRPHPPRLRFSQQPGPVLTDGQGKQAAARLPWRLVRERAVVVGSGQTCARTTPLLLRQRGKERQAMGETTEALPSARADGRWTRAWWEAHGDAAWMCLVAPSRSSRVWPQMWS